MPRKTVFVQIAKRLATSSILFVMAGVAHAQAESNSVGPPTLGAAPPIPQPPLHEPLPPVSAETPPEQDDNPAAAPAKPNSQKSSARPAATAPRPPTGLGALYAPIGSQPNPATVADRARIAANAATPPPPPPVDVLPLLDTLPSTSILTGQNTPSSLPIGVRLRTFRVVPSVAVQGGVNNNIKATATAPISANKVQVASGLNFNNGNALNQISGYLHYDGTFYSRLHTENFYNVDSFFEWHRNLDLKNFVRVDGEVDRKTLDRTSIDNNPLTRSPVTFMQYLGAADLFRTLGPWGVRISGKVDRKTFDNAINDLTGRLINEVPSSNIRYSVESDSTYRLSPQVEAVMTVEANARRYDALHAVGVGATQRFASADSNGIRGLAGFDVQITGRLYGSAKVGYVAQYFRNPAFPNISGLSYAVDLLYIPSSSTTVRFTADRRVEEADNNVSVGRRRTEVSLDLGHNLQANWTVDLIGSYDNYDFQIGNRRPSGYGGKIMSRYMLNRNWSLLASTSYYDRSGGLIQDRFRQLDVLLGVVFAY